MRKFVALLIGFGFVTAALVAQTHDNLTEKTAKDSITLTDNLKIGSTVLGPGEYRVVCDAKTVTFTRKSDKVTSLEVPCKGTTLAVKSETTVMHTSLDRSGVRVLDKLHLRGSNVEHTFK